MPKRRAAILLLSLLCTLAKADDFTYTTNNGTITITRYTGRDGSLTIPDQINGFPVTSLGFGAFGNCSNLTQVVIPNSVTNIGMLAFANCVGLTNMAIPANAITVGEAAFLLSFGLQTNHFGFRISWATNASVIVEASPSLTTPSWSPIATNTITMGIAPLTDGWAYFTDPHWTNHSTRFYRIRSP